MNQDAANPTEFANTIKKLLDEGCTVQVLNLFTDNKHDEEIKNNSWDLIPIIANYLDKETEIRNIEVFKCCEKLINIVASDSKPEEALLQFIEEIETSDDDTKFLMLLRPLQQVLLRVPEKRITSLAWCFNSISTYLKKLDIPEDTTSLDDDKITVDDYTIIERITFLYSELLNFCKIFVVEFIKHGKGNTDRCHILRKSLIQLLGKPIIYLNLENENSKIQEIVESLMKQLQYLIHDPFVFLEMNDNDYNSDLMKPNDLALGAFYYLILTQDFCKFHYPKIYNPIYILRKCLKLINELLSKDNTSIIYKGFALTNFLLNSIENCTLSYLLLDDPNHSKFCKYLSNIIIHNENKKIRQGGLGILHKYLWSFDHKGRYLLFYNLMNCLKHSGLKGNLITVYKEMLHKEATITKFQSISTYYKEQKLFNLIEKFTEITDKTEIIDESDQIISTLNFIRYLIIVDKNGFTSIKNILNDIEKNYLNELQTKIELAKTHYELKIKELNQENSKGDRENNDCKLSVTVGGKDLLEPPLEKKIEITNLSLTTLDVIQSLLSIVTSCIECKNDTLAAFTSFRYQSTSQSTGNYDEDIKEKILEASLPFVVEMGWSQQALKAGAQKVGYPGVTRGLFSNGGADLVSFFQKQSNLKLVEILKKLEEERKTKPIPPAEFVEIALKERLQMIVPYLSRWPQAIAIMALPPNVPNALATLLTTVDDICYYAGDRSIDFNWYARRLGVAGVYKASEIYLIQDSSPEYENTWKFLHRRVTEAVQIHDIICKADLGSPGVKDTAVSAFVTARNILGLNWTR